MNRQEPTRQEMDRQDTALYFFRKLVYLLYLEIGALQPHNHPELAARAKLKTAYFQREKERQAAELYSGSVQENTPAKILAPYEERTGLSLEDVHRAFAEGDWRNKFGGFNFGGPKWEKVAEVTLRLRAQIDQGHWEEVERVLFEIKSLKTDQGYLIHQFDRTDRRRR